MYYMVEIVRLPIVEGRLPAATTLLAAIGLAIATLFLGAWSFTRRADEFAYRL
jgi:ABC-type polysaccharide/polyol phosphate export permease